MPALTPRWRRAAYVMAALGFIAVLIQGNPILALLNALIWFGVVYLVFLVGRGLTWLVQKATGSSNKEDQS